MRVKIYAPDMALHEDLLRHARVCEILHDADEAKRLSREARGAEASRNDGERLHNGLSGAREAANCTPLKLHPCPSLGKRMPECFFEVGRVELGRTTERTKRRP